MRSIVVLSVVLVTFSGGLGAASPGESPQPAKRMVLTIDDLPVSLGSRHTPEQWSRITSGLLDTLARHRVPAVGFVNESKVESAGVVDPAKVAHLERWLDAGIELGNHTYSHPDLHRVLVDEWTADAAKGERLLRPMIEERGLELRYFRHPFLHTGMTPEVQKAASAWLDENGYTVAPVTVDNSEWVYGGAYSGAYNSVDCPLMDRIGDSYVDYMLDVVEYHEGQAEKIVGRAIPQILLIHAYALNADHLDTLLDRLEADGWTWITLEEALRDPAYRRPWTGYLGRGGITWLHRWAITEGMDRLIFEGEPEVPGWIEEME